MTLIVGRRREGLDPYALPGNGPWGPERSMSSGFRITQFLIGSS